MEMDRYPDGLPSWIDLGCPSIDDAAAFYGGLFGWDVQPGPPEAGGYAQAYLRGRPVAGLGPQQNPGPPYWTCYVNVEDLDACAERVTANGGQVVVPPMDVMTAGRMAVFVDSNGAFVSAWQAGDHIGAGIVNEPGTFCWSEMLCDDLDAAARFYAAVFGWEAAPSESGDYTEFSLDGRVIAGMMAKPPMLAEAPPLWSIYFAVEDTEASVARAIELGGTQLVPPMDTPAGRFSALADPAGAVFSVIALAPDLAG